MGIVDYMELYIKGEILQMTRADILLETNRVIRENKLTVHANDHINAMADILDELWLTMLALEETPSLQKLGAIIRNTFEKEGKE